MHLVLEQQNFWAIGLDFEQEIGVLATKGSGLAAV